MNKTFRIWCTICIGFDWTKVELKLYKVCFCVIEKKFSCGCTKLLGVMYYECKVCTKNVGLVEQSFVRIGFKEKILDLVNHVHPVETSWCGKKF